MSLLGDIFIQFLSSPAPFPLLPTAPRYPWGHWSSRDCGGCQPLSQWHSELELRQAGQWALGHGAPGKPSSAPLMPRATQPSPGTCRRLPRAIGKPYLLSY